MTTIDFDREGSNLPNVDTSDKEPETKSNALTVILDGPLSSIYTKALNIALAKDNITTEKHIAILSAIDMALISEQGEEQRAEELGDQLYVYCTDDDNINQGKLVETTDKLRVALDNKNHSKVMLAMECRSSNISTSVVL